MSHETAHQCGFACVVAGLAVLAYFGYHWYNKKKLDVEVTV